MKNNLPVIEEITRKSGLTLLFYKKNLFKVRLKNFPDLSFEDLIRLNNFDHAFYNKKPSGSLSFIESIPKPLKSDFVDLWFFRVDGSRKLSRNDVIDLHISNEIVGHPSLQLSVNHTDVDFAKDFPTTAFWGNEKGFFHSIIHFSETKTIEGRNFDFRDCAPSCDMSGKEWYVGVDKHLAPKIFENYKRR
jgi:hypothetical protein